jgi:DNA-binding response OmpR family regulator
MTRGARIVILDDERDLGEALAEYLSRLGHTVTYCAAAWEFDAVLAAGAPDLLVLDLNLPGEGGLSILTRLGSKRAFPVIVLTGNQDLVDRVLGLEMGADDFVLKPVNPRELSARIAGLLNRQAGRVRPLVMFETASVDIAAARVLKANGDTERLSAGEIALIRAFSLNPGKVLTRDELLELAPAESEEAYDRSIDSRITRLRRKLDTEALQTVRGRGYVFHPPHRGGGGKTP